MGLGARDFARWYRPVMAGLTAILLTIAGVVAYLAWSKAAGLGRAGADLTLYVDATRGWLSGTGFYPLHQLAGPYVITDGDILYPPSAILLFVPFLVLPPVFFWVIPIGLQGWVLIRHRPAPWTWPLMALCLAYPPTTVKLVHANPLMWISMAVALGTIYDWPAVLAMLKPTLAPFALIGIRTRRWWLAAGVLILVGIPFGALWGQYATVILDSRNTAGALYSVSDVPMVLLPLVAWLGRDQRAGQARRVGSEPSPEGYGADLT